MEKHRIWKSNIIRFLISQMTSLFGSSIVQYSIIWYITLETQSGIMMTIATLCGFLPQVIISLFAGVWADKFNKKKIIMISDSFIALAALIIAVAFITGFDNIYLLMLILVVRSFGVGIQTPTVNSFIPELVPKDKLLRINGINTTAQSIMMVVSPIIAGALLATLPLGYILLVDVITAIVGVGILSSIKYKFSPIKIKEKIDYFEEIKEGITYTKNERFISHILIYLAMLSFLLTPFAILTPLLVARTFGADAWHLTANETVFFCGTILGGILISTWGGFRSKIKTVGLACVICGLFATALGFSSNFIIYLIFMGFLGVTMPLFNTPLITLLQEIVPEDKMGRIFSLVQIISNSIMPLAMILFGPLAEIISIETIVIVTGFLFIIVSILLLRDKILKIEMNKLLGKK